jgi:transposase InsO family protein
LEQVGKSKIAAQEGKRQTQRPCLLTENGPSHVATELAIWLDRQGMRHIRGQPHHPMMRGKIERRLLSLKSRISRGRQQNYFGSITRTGLPSSQARMFSTICP